MKWTIWISILLLCLTGIGEVQAQNDPVLAGMIAAYTEKAEKELKGKAVEAAKEEEYLKYRLSQLESAKLKKGEKEELEEELCATA